MLRNVPTRLAGFRAGTRRPPGACRQPLSLESLEDRCLMAGDLDPTFAGDGTTTAGFGLDGAGSFDFVTDVAVQADGKVVVVGTADRAGANDVDFGVMRFNADGTLDTTFSGDGKAVAAFDLDPGGNQDRAAAVAIDAAGNIHVAGTVETPGNDAAFGVAKFGPAGNLIAQQTFDFDRGGQNRDEARGIAIDNDGNLIVVGSVQFSNNDSDFGILKLAADLTPVFAFGGDGRRTYAFDLDSGNVGDRDVANAVAVDSQNNVVVVGEAENDGNTDDIVVLKVTSNGDPVFRRDFKLPTDGDERATGVAIGADDVVYVGGHGDGPGGFEDGFVARLDPTDGAFDTAFAGGGLAVFDGGTADNVFVNDLAIDAAGRPVLVGFYQSRPAVFRLTGDGVPDAAFGPNNDGRASFRFNGAEDGEAFGVAVDAVGRLVVAGNSFPAAGGNFGVARLLSDSTAPIGAFDPVPAVPPRYVPPGMLTLRFDEPVTGVDAGDFVVTRDGVPVAAALTVTAVATTSGIDATTWIVSDLPRAGAGMHVVTLAAAGSGIADLAGNALATDATVSFTVQPNRGFPAELAVFRNGTFFIDNTRDGVIDQTVAFGQAGDQGLMADWDGDNVLDFIVYRGNRFLVDTDRDGVADSFLTFGDGDDKAFVVDFDGDGKVDPIVYDDSGAVSTWRIDFNRDGAADFTQQYGVPGDRPFVGDFDNNGTLDLGLYRNGPATSGNPFMQFFFDTAGDGGTAESEVWFGVPGDEPFLGDFDNDGRLDPGVFRYSTAVVPGQAVNQFFFDVNRDGGAGEAEVWLRSAATPSDTAVLVPPGQTTTIGAGSAGGQGGSGSGTGGPTRTVTLDALVPLRQSSDGPSHRGRPLATTLDAAFAADPLSGEEIATS